MTTAGVDVGGTFTDCAAITTDGRVVTRKVLSTPSDQGVGVADALNALGFEKETVSRVVHGTTVVTNLLLERTGAKLVLCATDGATDLLELRRQDRVSLYDLAAQHPAPLVLAENTVAVRERNVVPRGESAAGGEGVTGGANSVLNEIKKSLDPSELNRVVQEVVSRRPEGVVVSLLHSYADARHEEMLAQALRAALPGVPVVTSTEVLAEIREYERTATAVAEAYSRPRVSLYLERLSSRLTELGFPAPAVMTSGGGMLSSHDAATRAASLALSGPAGGVVGAAAVLADTGIATALTIDIGGTSADAGLIQNGEPLVEPGGSVAGVPIALPRVLVETVSAGGGSVAWIDDGGALRVGPRSAGAVPGPVAFARGGSEPTVTDAQVVLGRIRSAAMSGGVDLDIEGARKAVESLSMQLGATVGQTAQAIIDIADAEMARALRRVSVERGVDPRSAVLVASGGGGPLHACALAERLSMTRVLIPPYAGVLSAVGLAIAPERQDTGMSLLARCNALSADTLNSACNELAQRVSGTERRWVARVRYVGQGHELDIACKPGDSGESLARDFDEAHKARYGYLLPHEKEVVALRHSAGDAGTHVAFRRDPELQEWNGSDLVDSGGPASGVVLSGPVAVTLTDATLWIARGWRARARTEGGWMLERSESVTEVENVGASMMSAENGERGR